MYDILNSLKDVCSGSVDRVTRVGKTYADGTLTTMLGVLDNVMTIVVAEFNEERMDAVEYYVVKLAKWKRHRQFFEGGGTLPVDPVMRFCPH